MALLIGSILIIKQRSGKQSTHQLQEILPSTMNTMCVHQSNDDLKPDRPQPISCLTQRVVTNMTHRFLGYLWCRQLAYFKILTVLLLLIVCGMCVATTLLLDDTLRSLLNQSQVQERK